MKVSEIKVSYLNNSTNQVKITNSKAAYELILLGWDKNIINFQEEVKVILFNRANIVIGIYELSRGGSTSSIVDLKIILAVSLKCSAQSIMLVHNHPSGNLTPSEADIKITNKLKKACEIVDLVLLDHLIISNDGYYSFNDANKL